MSIQEIYDYYGTIIKAAAAVGVTRQTFHVWMRKNKIPKKYENLYQQHSKGRLKAAK